MVCFCYINNSFSIGFQLMIRCCDSIWGHPVLVSITWLGLGFDKIWIRFSPNKNQSKTVLSKDRPKVTKQCVKKLTGPFFSCDSSPQCLPLRIKHDLCGGFQIFHRQWKSTTRTHTHTYFSRWSWWVSVWSVCFDWRETCLLPWCNRKHDGHVSQRYRFESCRGQWALYSLIPSALSFVFLWHASSDSAEVLADAW